jgi:uncharacterized YkwD family protein
MKRRFVKSVVSLAIFSLLMTPALGAQDASAASLYRVKKGDTMYLIAQRNGISLDAFLRANPHVTNPNVIWEGMPLIVPGAGKTSGPANGVTKGAPKSPANGPVSGGTSGAEANLSAYASEVVRLVNEERAAAGLKPLQVHAGLTTVAMDKAKDLYHNNYFSHYSPTYGSPFDMMRSYGISFRYAGENIAKGQRNPQEVMKAWMNSDGHRANILSPNFTHIGVAYYNGVWVQAFLG